MILIANNKIWTSKKKIKVGHYRELDSFPVLTDGLAVMLMNMTFLRRRTKCVPIRKLSLTHRALFGKWVVQSHYVGERPLKGRIDQFM